MGPKASWHTVPILHAKKDIADAFKWLSLLAESAGLFFTRFKKGQAGLKHSVILIWLVLNFGWRSGPGCFVQCGTLLKLLHTNSCPDYARHNDATPFCSMVWMDDLVII